MRQFGGVRIVSPIAACLAVAALLVAADARAQNAQSADPGKAAPVKQEAPVTAASVGAGGVMVFIDPATGKIRQPSPEEIGALAKASAEQRAMLERPTAPARPTATAAKGLVALALDDSTMSYLVVTRQPDGKLKKQCVIGDQTAGEVVASAPASKVAKKEAGNAH